MVQIEEVEEETKLVEQQDDKPAESLRSPIFEERIAAAEEFKIEGNKLFRERQWNEALTKFQMGLYHCDFDELQFNFELLDSHRESVVKIRVPLLLNAAACCQKLDLDSQSIDYCSNAIKLDEVNTKAYYRRGQSYRRMKEYEKAKKDLTKAAKMEPSDRTIRKSLNDLVMEMKSQGNSEKKLWAKAFEKNIENPDDDISKDYPEPTSPVSVFRGMCSKFISWIFGFDTKTQSKSKSA